MMYTDDQPVHLVVWRDVRSGCSDNGWFGRVVLATGLTREEADRLAFLLTVVCGHRRLFESCRVWLDDPAPCDKVVGTRHSGGDFWGFRRPPEVADGRSVPA